MEILQRWGYTKKSTLFIGTDQLKTNTTKQIRDTGFKFKTI